MPEILAGVYDGDTPSATRRRLRDAGSVIFTNPDMLHAALMPQHARWARFLGQLKLLVLDELHVYSGIFGSNMANLMRRFLRVCGHYGSEPQIVSCSATIGNPKELAERLTGRKVTLIDRDGSPRGRRMYVFWNPPRIRTTSWRSRRSANVEAHELMAMLIRRDVPTITFSKAKMTAEMIHRYVCDALRESAPQLVSKVSPYRGGYRPEERREIERRLFSGELLGVSTTRALELGIDVGGLDASILVGYPGTLARHAHPVHHQPHVGLREGDQPSLLRKPGWPGVACARRGPAGSPTARARARNRRGKRRRRPQPGGSDRQRAGRSRLADPRWVGLRRKRTRSVRQLALIGY